MNSYFCQKFQLLIFINVRRIVLRKLSKYNYDSPRVLARWNLITQNIQRTHRSTLYVGAILWLTLFCFPHWVYISTIIHYNIKLSCIVVHHTMAYTIIHIFVTQMQWFMIPKCPVYPHDRYDTNKHNIILDATIDRQRH